MNLTPHFTLAEVVDSKVAAERRIDNTPPDDVIGHLGILAVGLERVRSLLGAPMRINSGYRCPLLNAAVGGVPNSAHLSGYAADFVCPQYGDPLSIVEFLAQCPGLEFDQVIQEGTWVHLSFAPAMRHEVLTAHFNSEHKASYSEGA